MRLSPVTLLLLACLLSLCYDRACAQHSNAAVARTLQANATSANGGAANANVATLREGVFTYWLQHGPDTQYGGFHGTLDRKGSPMDPTRKTIVQQARHLWAMSALLATNKQSPTEARSAADSLFNFIKNNMITIVSSSNATNKASGGANSGRAFVYEVSRDGKTKTNAAINVYANAFAMYGLAKYAQVTGTSEALNLALETLSTLDALYGNMNGGYDESNTVGGLVFDSISLSTQPASSEPGGEVNEKGNSNSNNGAKPKLSQSFNTLLHMTEALAEVSRATAGNNGLVQQRLLEHVNLLTGPLVVKQQGKSPAAYIAPNYDPQTWTVVGGLHVNYGHNIEAAWLLADAVDELQSRGALTSSIANDMKANLRAIGEAAIQAGYDNQYQGLFTGGNVGDPAGAVPSDSSKVWWVQAETLLGLDWLYRQTGTQQYNSQLHSVLKFVAQNIWDKQYGEWYSQVAREGTPPLPYETGGERFAASVKGNMWKASYHSGRAVLGLEQLGYK
eukprot:GHRR01004403.1.p1 GENE.GHRR01004403.1~~GHRR01004403.1.p1  ORF type:complete len:506 (+),score=141.63 GHRR01004403.1:471-1988(+)